MLHCLQQILLVDAKPSRFRRSVIRRNTFYCWRGDVKSDSPRFFFISCPGTDELNLYYASALFFSTFLSVTVAFTAWRRRLAPGATGLALFALSNAVWAFAYAIHWCAAEPTAQRFWLDATYLGVIAGPFSIIVFTLQFTRRLRRHLCRRMRYLLKL